MAEWTPPSSEDWSKRNAQVLQGLLAINQFLPVTGDIQSGILAANDLQNKQYGSAALNAVGLLPFIPALGGIIKGAPYRQAVSGLLQGDATQLGMLAQDFNKRAQTPLGILSVKPVSSYFTENFSEGLGKVISSPHGEIAVLSNSPYSPRTHSVTKFVVDESKRNKGYGKELIDEVLKQYPTDIGAQVSSPASAKAFYKKGFRLASDPNASIDDIFKNIEEYSSAYMVK